MKSIIITICLFFIFVEAYSLSPADSSKVTTFSVAQVVPAKQPLPEISIQEAFLYRVGKELYTFETDSNLGNVVPAFTHGLIQTIQNAYADHRPLVLSPDHIWLMVCQGVSLHINQNFKKCESVVFKTNKPDKFIVRNDSLITGQALYWDSLIRTFSDSVKLYTQPKISDLMLSHFSTTQHREEMAYAINMLDAAQKAFSYTGMSGCGIPTISLTGTVADWEKIYHQVDHFNVLGLSQWTESIKPLLLEFVQAKKGNVNLPFWNGIYKESSFYGTYNISGWIIKFFPYIKEYYIDTTQTNENGGWLEGFTYVSNIYAYGENNKLSKINTRHFPSGLSKINIKWLNYFESQETDMEVYAGFMGMRQDKKTLALTPFIDWAVCKVEAPSRPEYMDYFPTREDLPHPADLWVSDVDTLTDKAPIYAPDINTDSATSMKYLNNYLTKQVGDLLGEKTKEIKSLAIRFVLTWNGTVAQSEITHRLLTVDDIDRIKILLQHLPHPWRAALKKVEMGEDKLYKTNYQIEMVLKW